MKVKFNKNAFGYKANDEIEIEASEAKAFGDAVTEVKVSAEDIASKAADELMASVDAKIGSAVDTAVAKALSKAASKRPSIHVGPDNITNDPKRGFKNFGCFAKSIMNMAKYGKDEALTKSGLDENTNADGGYVVPVEYAKMVFAIIMGEQSLLPMTYNLPTSTNYLKLPIDNLVTIGTNPITGGWISSDGTALSETGTGSFNQLSFTLNKYGVLVGVTDELLVDNDVALEQFLVRKAGYDITYAINQAIVQGTGSGQPQGIVSSNATVSLTGDSGDEYVSGVAFDYNDICNMRAHFLKSMNPNPVWLVNPLLLQDMYRLKDDDGRNLFFAPGTLQQTPYASMFGIPVIESWHCSKRGFKGDIILADMSAYVAVTRMSGVEAATSIHLWFDKDKTAYRFTFRIDGRPGLAQALTGPQGGSFSPFVVLANRT